jgi:hypothetical protein
MGSPLKSEEGDVHTAEFLRSDLHVVNAGVAESPGMELGAEAMFHRKYSELPSAGVVSLGPLCGVGGHAGAAC